MAYMGGCRQRFDGFTRTAGDNKWFVFTFGQQPATVIPTVEAAASYTDAMTGAKRTIVRREFALGSRGIPDMVNFKNLKN